MSPADPDVAYLMLHGTREEQIRHIYGSMTPEESLEILYEAGILTPKGKLSAKYR